MNSFIWKYILIKFNDYLEKPSLLLLDNFSGHIVRTDDLDKLTVVFLPPKSTSKHQLLDKGIIAALKRKYVGKLSQEKLIIFEN